MNIPTALEAWGRTVRGKLTKDEEQREQFRKMIEFSIYQATTDGLSQCKVRGYRPKAYMTAVKSRFLGIPYLKYTAGVFQEELNELGYKTKFEYDSYEEECQLTISW